MNKAIKKFTLPFQIVLQRRRLCPGCTHPLDKLDRQPFRANKAMLQCKCKRRYLLDLDTNSYRRATFDEEREYLNKK